VRGFCPANEESGIGSVVGGEREEGIRDPPDNGTTRNKNRGFLGGSRRLPAHKLTSRWE